MWEANQTQPNQQCVSRSLPMAMQPSYRTSANSSSSAATDGLPLITLALFSSPASSRSPATILTSSSSSSSASTNSLSSVVSMVCRLPTHSHITQILPLSQQPRQSHPSQRSRGLRHPAKGPTASRRFWRQNKASQAQARDQYDRSHKRHLEWSPRRPPCSLVVHKCL